MSQSLPTLLPIGDTGAADGLCGPDGCLLPSTHPAIADTEDKTQK